MLKRVRPASASPSDRRKCARDATYSSRRRAAVKSVERARSSGDNTSRSAAARSPGRRNQRSSTPRHRPRHVIDCRSRQSSPYTGNVKRRPSANFTSGCHRRPRESPACGTPSRDGTVRAPCRMSASARDPTRGRTSKFTAPTPASTGTRHIRCDGCASRAIRSRCGSCPPSRSRPACRRRVRNSVSSRRGACEPCGDRMQRDPSRRSTTFGPNDPEPSRRRAASNETAAPSSLSPGP